MKKLLIGLMCLLTVTFTTFGLVGCSKKNKTSASESSSVSTSVATSESSSVVESSPASTSEGVSVEETTSTSEGSSVQESTSESTSAGCSHSLTVIKKDGEYHWYECECGEQSGEKQAHNYDEGVITKNPTEQEEGEKLLTCQTCGATTTTSVPKAEHVHALVKNNGTPATCTEAGVKDTWKCSGCQKTYLDAQATQEVVSEASLVIPAINHANEVFSHRVDPRCGVAGADVYVCPDCQRPREEPIDALEHDWKTIEVVEATCEHGGYTLQKCAHCQNEQKINETGITDCDEEYVVVDEASCDETGIAKYVCKDCKKEREIVLPKCDHVMNVIDTVEPTCEEQGYNVYKCDNCEHNYKDDLVDSLGGHDMVVDEANSHDATCLENGITVYVCSRGCASATYSEETDALGHDEVAPTCTQEGYCTRCDDVRVAKLTHSLEIKEDVAPTCTEDGYVVYGCKDCEHLEAKQVPDTHKATGHAEDQIEWVEEEIKVEGETCKYYVKTSGVCPTCQTTIVKEGEVYESHTYTCAITTAATCIAEGVKTYTCTCSHSYTENYEIDESAHKLDAGVQEGNYLVYSCQNGDCGHTERVLHIVDEAVDANVVKDAEKLSVGDATLKLDDQTKGQLGEGSSVALSAGTLDGADLEDAKGKLSEDQLALLGNSSIYNFEMEVDGEPVTNFDGYITIRIPYDLDGQDPEDIVVWYINNETPTLIQARYIEIDGQGYAEFETNHFSYYSVAKMTPAERCAIYGCYTEGSVTVLPATCLEGGYTLTVCRRCGKKTYTDRVPALGHDWAEVEELHVDVACMVNGYEKHECTRCQVAYEVKTPAHGHEWVKNDARTVAPTCTNEGSVTFECVHCDNEYYITEKKTAHKYSTSVVEATCTTAGYTNCVCVDCGHTATKNPTPALGHSIVDTVHAPTCIDKGYTSHVCSRCDEVFANTDYTDKADHEWDKDEPTCEEDKLCKHCKKRDENNGKAKGHYMEDGKCKHCSKPCNHTFKYSHTVESTCSGAGYEVWVCKHCQATEFRGETGVASHDFALLKEVAPTCQTAGYKVEVCRACGYTQTTETSPAVDHSYTNGKCIYCGLIHAVEEGYIDVLATIKNANGVVIKIDELDYKLYDVIDGEQELEGKFNAIKALELMLYVDDDGNIQGAASGAIQIYNGPVRNGYASYAFKGLIEGDYLYVLVNVEDGNSYELTIKYSVQDMFASMMGRSVDSEALGFVLDSEVLALVEEIATSVNPKVSAVFSEIIAVLFSTEKVGDETVFTLDFDKLRELNDDLAHLTVGDAVSKYFGEELLPSLKKLARQLVFLEVNDLPEFIEEKGLPADAIFNALNAIAKAQGAPEGYDIRAMFEDPEMAGVTVGDLVLGEDFGFDDMMAMVDEMQGYPAYALILDAPEDMVEDIYQMVDSMITMFEGISISFTTDSNGIVQKLNVSATDFVFGMEAMYMELTISLSLSVNATIDVTWRDIVGDIEEEIVLPEGLEDQYEGYYDYVDSDQGELEIDGTWYQYQVQFTTLERNYYKYSEIVGVIAKEDCGDWIEYSLVVPCYRWQRVTVGLLMTMSKDGDMKYFFTNGYNIEDRVELTVNQETGELSFVDVNGNVVYLSLEKEPNYFDVAELAFGITEFEYDYLTYTNESVYYNKATGVYDGETHHNFVLDEENSYAPAECEEQGLRYYVCTECGEVYKDYYTKGHNTVSKTKLSVGSTTCDDGVDMYYECKDCGKITDYHENWSKGCHMTYVIKLENGEVKRSGECHACGRKDEDVVFTVDSDYALEIYDGAWGKPSTGGKPNTGIGGNMNGSAEISKRDGITFKFVATEDATIEFYEKVSGGYYYGQLYGSVYDKDFNGIAYAQGNLEYGNFGLTYDFVAGETYYVVVSGDLYSNMRRQIVFKRVVTETVDLANYGCGCGGEMVISTQFGKKVFEINAGCGVGEYETCSQCGFVYYSDAEWTMNETCEEVIKTVVYFYNEFTGESFEYVVYEFKTGNVKHNTYSDELYERREDVDENGNPIYVEIRVNQYVCDNCGQIADKTVYEYTYDSDGNEIAYAKYEYNWSSNLGKCTLYWAKEYTYVRCVDENGNYYNRTKTAKETYYDENGEIESWDFAEYTYHAESPCKVTVKRTSSYGKGQENTYYDHSYSRKELPDESFVEEVMLDGAWVAKNTQAYEEYCPSCYASLEKYVDVEYVDENGNVVKSETYRYKPYAESQDVYGWEISNYDAHTYGYVQYSYQYFRYETSYEYIYYSEGSRGEEIDHYQKTVYEYVDPTCSCEYQTYRYDRFGNLIKEDYEYEKEQRHIAPDSVYMLTEGATSCSEGLEYYEICYVCGYKECWGDYREDHYTSLDYAHLDNVDVYELSDYGQVCGATLLVVSCPCGTSKDIYYLNGDEGCDYSWDSEWLYDDENKVNHHRYTYHCAVSDPACGFSYSREYWYSRNDKCEETFNEVWVFGLNSDCPLVITSSYGTGDYLHDYESHSQPIQTLYEDGYTVHYETNESICKICSHVGSKYESWNYYLVTGEGEEENWEQVRRLDLYTYYYEFGDRVVYRTDYDESAAIVSQNGQHTAWVRFFAKSTYYYEDGSLQYWSQDTYSYDECIHTPLIIYETMNGEYRENRDYHDIYDYDFDHYIVEPTCTQSGIEHRTCYWCQASEDFEVGCYGHSYSYIWREEFDGYVHVCDRCDLVNFTGYDGNVIMEDMTDASQGVFTVGYHFINYFDYIIAVSLIVDGQEEPIVLYVDANDDYNSLITVSFDDVRQACNEYGLVFEDVMVKVTILPTNGDYSFDYSVTMDSHQGA